MIEFGYVVLDQRCGIPKENITKMRKVMSVVLVASYVLAFVFPSRRRRAVATEELRVRPNARIDDSHHQITLMLGISLSS